jgi:parallel beta-helix repeat protein
MKRKALALTFVMAVLVSTVGIELAEIAVADPYIPPEEAPSGYRIYSDGTCDAPNLRRDGNTYTFTGDIEGTIVIERDGIVLDGANTTLSGKGVSFGVWLQDRSEVTIKNLNIRNFGDGIRFSHYAPDWHTGPKNPNYTTNCTIEACTVTNNDNGISFYSCVDCKVLANYIKNNTFGISGSGSGNTFRNNKLEGNQYGFSVKYFRYNDVDTSTTVNGKPIYYLVNQHDLTIPADAGQVVLTDCRNIEVQNLSLTGNGEGIALFNTSGSKIYGNIVSNNDVGIVIYQSSNNSVKDNQITNNANNGITQYYSNNSIISKNLVKGNTVFGVFGSDSENSTISSNRIIDNKCGMFLNSFSNCTLTDNFIYANTQGIVLPLSSGFTIAGNNITQNTGPAIFYDGKHGVIKNNYISRNQIGIQLYGCSYNTITSNNIVENVGFGIQFGNEAENNLIYHNNFIDNNGEKGTQVFFKIIPKDMSVPTNSWDDGKEGNYWSDYNGRGPYYINENNQDNHPLSAPLDFAALELPFPTALVIAASGASIAIIAVGLLVYFKKRQKEAARA